MPSGDNLESILSFVEESLLKDQKAIRRLAEYPAPLFFHEAAVRQLINVRYNEPMPNGQSWLRVSRVIKTKPPLFPVREAGAVTANTIVTNAAWVVVPDGPEGTPSVRDGIRVPLSKGEAERLLQSELVHPSDLYEDARNPGQLIGLLRIEKFPEVVVLFEHWLNTAWLPWAEREKPIRKSASFYEELFRIHTGISGRDLPLEVVFGMGVVRGQISDSQVDHPLIEYQVYLEVDPISADIYVRPSPRPPELFEFDTADLAGDRDALRRFAKAHWDQLPDQFEPSPFERQHWEPILKAATTFLRDGAEFVEVEETREIKKRPAPLGVYDAWVLFVRPTSSKPMIADVRALKEEIRKAESLDPIAVLLDDPAAADPMKQRMPDRIADLFGEMFGSAGGTGPVRQGESKASGSGAHDQKVAPYFPRVSNADQARIIRILESEDTKGLVVQGPPGTGKSHTIANIICHGLSRGWRILVTAHSDGPLHVLRNMLPESIRDLAVNLSTGEHQEVMQLEQSVKAISSIPGRVGDVNSRLSTIQRVEGRILENRQRVAEIDSRFLDWADKNLERKETYLGNLSAGELAERLVGASSQHIWLDDVIPLERIAQPLSEEEAGRIRLLRGRLDESIKAYEWVLPDDVTMPSADELVSIHQALAEHVRLSELSTDVQFAHLASVENGKELATQLLSLLEEVSECLDLFEITPWLWRWHEELRQPEQNRLLGAALPDIISQFNKLASGERNLVVNQVVIPRGAPKELRGLVQSGASGRRTHSTLPFLRPTEEVLQALDSLRVRGRRPSSAADWSAILEGLNWIDEVENAQSRWNALAERFSLDVCPADPDQAVVWIKQTANSVLQISRLEESVLANVDACADKLGRNAIRSNFIKTDPAQIAKTKNTVSAAILGLKIRLSQIDVVWAQARHLELIERLAPYKGPISEQIMSFIQGLGDQIRDALNVRRSWKALVDALELARAQFTDGKELQLLVDKIRVGGAPLWANRLLTIPRPKLTESAQTDNSDELMPAHWQVSWQWSAWHGYLQNSRSLSKVRELVSERAKLEAEIRVLMNELVGLRTELQLSKMPRSILTNLQQFQSVMSQLGAGTGVRAARRRKEAQALALKCSEAVPCWIMPLKKVSETQPARLGMFDLIIIDEASQCGPEAVPVLLRGKKALIVGDDKQVSPTSFLSEEAYRQLKVRYLQDTQYQSALAPGSSLYDLASAMFAGNNVLLREHFRCVEPIIRFSMSFYEGGMSGGLVPLRVPTVSERLDPPLIDIYVPFGTAVGQKNEAEALVIVKEIERISKLPEFSARSIGVISLSGSYQAELIERMLQDRLGAGVFKDHDILVADSSGFQGKERSIVFLSMVDAKNRRSAARTQDMYQQRYNVALSRARDRMYLVHSLTTSELQNQNDLRRKVLLHFENPMPTIIKRNENSDDLESLCDSGFERDVLRRLLVRGYSVTPGVPAAGYRIDMVVEGKADKRLAIELDGDIWHPPEQYQKDMYRQQALERIGFHFWRCWWSEWTLDPDRCFTDLLAKLTTMGIEPSQGNSSAPFLYAERYIADAEGQLWTPAEFEIQQRVRGEGDEVSSEDAEYGEPIQTSSSAVRESGSPQLHLLLSAESGARSPSGQARTLDGELLSSGSPKILEGPRGGTSSASQSTRVVRPGDIVVVEGDTPPFSGRRTFEFRHGDQIDLAKGNIGVESELGKRLGSCLEDDCIEVLVDEKSSYLLVVGFKTKG